MLLRLLILNQQFPFLPIPSRLLPRDLDDREVGVAFAEDAVHFLEGAVGGFGVEEVDAGDHEGVAVGVGLILVLDGDGG